jgi:hypothetical protein
MSAGFYDLKIEWHSPDQIFAAVFVRDGEPWFLEGALVGMDETPGLAVADLLDLAHHIVVHGGNFLTDGPIPKEDRIWLAQLMDMGNDTDAIQERYLAMREAGVKL